METELNDPAFDAPGAPQKWLVMLWGLAIVVAIGTEFTRYNMSKKNETKKNKTIHSEAGKGSVPRRGISQNRWEERWEKIFNKKKKKKNK